MALMGGSCDWDLFQASDIGPLSGVAVAGPIGKSIDSGVVVETEEPDEVA